MTKKLEAILFYLAEPADIDFLAKILEIKNEELKKAMGELAESLKSRGIRLVAHDNEISLVTAPDFSGLIEKIVKEERERELGRAGIETLAIVAYKGPVSRKEIDYIRGVNSQFALRNLLMRGLVERKAGEQDERIMMYTITSDTLRYLGLSKIEDLPEYSDMKQKLEVDTDQSEDEDNI